jgi:uncharacterized protein YhbP (UPF0306 family)
VTGTAQQDIDATARSIVDDGRYMTLGTADAEGHPWATPVWYAPDGYREFFWVSAPEARHSRNLAERPEAGIVIFDSNARIGTGQGLYMAAVVDRPSGAERERGMDVFSRRSQAQGAGAWTLADVEGDARLRLYRATASEHFVLDARDRRVPVSLA